LDISLVSSPLKKRRRRELPGLKDSDDEDAFGPESDDLFLAVDDALRYLRDPQTTTQASTEIEICLWKRISGFVTPSSENHLVSYNLYRYPEALKHHVHRANAYLPVDIERALQKRPDLVQKAVEAFYTRDGIQLRVSLFMTNAHTPDFETRLRIVCPVFRLALPFLPLSK
jgi:hypothetical protein